MKFLVVSLIVFTITMGCTFSKEKDSPSVQDKISETKKTINTSTVRDSLITIQYSEEADTTGLIEKNGTLNYTGNEPFAVPAIFDSDGKTYRLIADSTFMEETFNAINGQQVSLYGKVTQRNPHTFFEVHYYAIISNK